ncbi:hypothetical protein [Streptomyces sp. CNZ748]|uniref:hypothetical protein n=1 Tax=Streptomyces sp. CNZ748 TaxID=2885160 RepID=UPI001E4B5113|nr:hypothetical protein [Streptomyces sp. CNZ748]
MAAEQLPDSVREFTDHLRGLLARLDRYAGWCLVFWQRDPDGMRACLEGREPPPWDVVESLLHDLAAAHGPAVAEAEAPRARLLHAEATTAFDGRPGARQALSDRLDVMLREQRYAADRRAELTRRLASAAGREEADALGNDLAWAEDDHRRASARCAELTARMTALDRRTRTNTAPTGRYASGPTGTAARSGPAAQRAPLPPAGPASPARPATPDRSGQAPAPAPQQHADPAPDPTRTGRRPAPALGPQQHMDPKSRPSGQGRPAPAVGAHPHTSSAPDRAARGRRPVPGVEAEHSRPAPPRSPQERYPAPDPVPPELRAAQRHVPPAAPADGGPPPPRKRRRGGARFAGVEDGGEAPVVAPPAAVPELPVAAPVSRGARFAGAAADEGEQAGPPAGERAGVEDLRQAGHLVRTLVRLRREGRAGEAHAALNDAAYWPAVRFPLLADGMERAGLVADWTTLLWEAAASLPAERLVAAADALTAAGRAEDGEQILRQGVVRPADEIGRAALALADGTRHRELRALLDACVRMRTPQDAARTAAPDPRRLVPLLLTAARGVSEERHWDVLHALRVAGLAA